MYRPRVFSPVEIVDVPAGKKSVFEKYVAQNEESAKEPEQETVEATPEETVEEVPEEAAEEAEEEVEEEEQSVEKTIPPGASTIEDFLKVVRPQTPAYNPHFPNTNQTKHCWSSYINYNQCSKLKGANDAECRRFYISARSLCPDEWIDEWEESKEEEKFASPYEIHQ